MSTVINAALIGAGTVGGGLYRLQETMSEEIEKRVGAKLNIKKVLVRDTSKKREGIDPSVMTTDWNEIINDHDCYRAYGWNNSCKRENLRSFRGR